MLKLELELELPLARALEFEVSVGEDAEGEVDVDAKVRDLGEEAIARRTFVLAMLCVGLHVEQLIAMLVRPIIDAGADVRRRCGLAMLLNYSLIECEHLTSSSRILRNRIYCTNAGRKVNHQD